MVSEGNPGKAPKKPRHPRRSGKDTLFTANARLNAHLLPGNPFALWCGVTNRTNEHVEVDSQGVVLVKDGKRHVLHLWGDTPSVYLPH